MDSVSEKLVRGLLLSQRNMTALSKNTRLVLSTLSLGLALFAAVEMASPSVAHACGCFTPPNPSVPVVQAGERILFAMEDGVVTSHVQVQYSGAAEEFGWLLPLPSVPEFEVGTDELFTQLINTTQPRYNFNSEFEGNCKFPSFGGQPPNASDSSGNGAGEGGKDGDSVLVIRDTVGPYEYAVLRADSKEPMLTWLDENGFFVPAGTDDAVGPYIRPNAYFLALKLRKGNDVGDLQPVVVKYESDLPMIPIVLTGVAADPDMAIQVWVLGDDRAIPLNYHHTVLDDAKLDWFNFAANYIEVVIEAVDESDDHNSFVTEYAGTSSLMVNLLDPEWRFGNLAELAQLSDAEAYIQYLNNNSFPSLDPQTFNNVYSSQALSVLGRHLPMPAGLADAGVTPNDYYISISYYLGFFREMNPQYYGGLDLEFDPAALTAELDERVVTPTKAAGQLFRDYPYLTRLFTTLSPEEMLKDPVFAFNPDLPEVSNFHTGTLIYHCGLYSTDPATTPATFVTETGQQISYPQGTGTDPYITGPLPASLRTEILGQEGPPIVVYDNSAIIADALHFNSGCSVVGGSTSLGWFALLGLALALIRRRRR